MSLYRSYPTDQALEDNSTLGNSYGLREKAKVQAQYYKNAQQTAQNNLVAQLQQRAQETGNFLQQRAREAQQGLTSALLSASQATGRALDTFATEARRVQPDQATDVPLSGAGQAPWEATTPEAQNRVVQQSQALSDISGPSVLDQPVSGPDFTGLRDLAGYAMRDTVAPEGQAPDAIGGGLQALAGGIERAAPLMPDTERTPFGPTRRGAEVTAQGVREAGTSISGSRERIRQGMEEPGLSLAQRAVDVGVGALGAASEAVWNVPTAVIRGAATSAGLNRQLVPGITGETPVLGGLTNPAELISQVAMPETALEGAVSRLAGRGLRAVGRAATGAADEALSPAVQGASRNIRGLGERLAREQGITPEMAAIDPSPSSDTAAVRAMGARALTGGTVGGVAGYTTAPEDATQEEKLKRAAFGAVLGLEGGLHAGQLRDAVRAGRLGGDDLSRVATPPTPGTAKQLAVKGQLPAEPSPFKGVLLTSDRPDLLGRLGLAPTADDTAIRAALKREGYTGWKAATPDELNKFEAQSSTENWDRQLESFRTGQQIEPPTNAIERALTDWLPRRYAEWVDHLEPLRKAQNEIYRGLGRAPTAIEDVYTLARLFAGRHGSVAQTLERVGTALKGISRKGEDTLNTYLASWDNVDKAERVAARRGEEVLGAPFSNIAGQSRLIQANKILRARDKAAPPIVVNGLEAARRLDAAKASLTSAEKSLSTQLGKVRRSIVGDESLREATDGMDNVGQLAAKWREAIAYRDQAIKLLDQERRAARAIRAGVASTADATAGTATRASDTAANLFDRRVSLELEIAQKTQDWKAAKGRDAKAPIAREITALRQRLAEIRASRPDAVATASSARSTGREAEALARTSLVGGRDIHTATTQLANLDVLERQARDAAQQAHDAYFTARKDASQKGWGPKLSRFDPTIETALRQEADDLASELGRARAEYDAAARLEQPAIKKGEVAARKLETARNRQTRYNAQYEANRAAAEETRSVQAGRIEAETRESREFSGGVKAMRPEEIELELDRRMGADADDLRQRAKQLWNLVGDMRTRLYDAGLMSKKVFDELSEEAPHYVRTEILKYLRGATATLESLSTEGTDLARDKPLNSIARMVVATEEAVRKQQIAQGIVRMAEQNDDFAALMPRKARTKKEFDALTAAGKPVKEPDYSVGRDEQLFHVYVDGEKIPYVVSKAVGRALQVSPGSIPAGWRLAAAIAGAPLQRAMATTLNAAWLPVAPVLDAYQFMLRAGPLLKANPLMAGGELARAYIDVYRNFKGTPDLRKIRELGGSYSGMFGDANQTIRQLTGSGYLGGMVRRPGENVRAPGIQGNLQLAADYSGMVGDILALPFKPLEIIGERNEMAPRLAAYRLAKRMGLNEQKATLMARDITMDFSRKGLFSRVANLMLPFFDVGIQSLDRLATLDFAKGNRAKSAMAITVGVIAPAIAAEAWNQSQYPEDYADVPQWVKDRNIVFMLPIDAPAKPDGTRAPRPYWTLPLPPQLAFFKTIATEAVAAGLQKTTRPWNEFLGTLLAQLSPVPVDPEQATGALLPPLAEETISQLTSHDFFTGAPIIAPSQENLPPEEQSKPGTSAAMRGLGRATRQSPTRLQHAAQSIVPGAANIINPISNAIAAATGGEQGQPTATLGLLNTPVVGGAVSRFVGQRGGQQVQNTYARLDREQQQAVRQQIAAMQATAAWQRLTQQQRDDAVKRISNQIAGRYDALRKRQIAQTELQLQRAR